MADGTYLFRPVDQTFDPRPPPWITNLPRFGTVRQTPRLHSSRIYRHLEGKISWEASVHQSGSGTVPGRPEGGRRGTTSILFNRRDTHFASCQTYRHVVKESKVNSHPNVLPIIGVSKGPFPVCIMSPWMPDGNITQYTQLNPGANRLVLVRSHWWRLIGMIY